jgi:hypothetical protein
MVLGQSIEANIPPAELIQAAFRWFAEFLKNR